jgi:hypothetical protein
MCRTGVAGTDVGGDFDLAANAAWSVTALPRRPAARPGDGIEGTVIPLVNRVAPAAPSVKERPVKLTFPAAVAAYFVAAGA